MPAQIKESDWKTFRKLHTVALERFCRRVLVEIERINSDREKSSHQRYLDIFGLIQRRNREIADAFDDLRRSTAVIQLAKIQSHDLLTEEEFSRFSEDTRSTVEVLVGLRRE